MTDSVPPSRLARERLRLFGPASGGAGTVRALVLQVGGPALWRPLATVWQGVQAEFGLPAPAIAVDGRDALQLWFPLAEGVEAAQALAWLEALRQRWMPEVPAHRVAWRACDAAPPVPGRIGDDGPWSAFVAADLAPLFEETPWLDLPPTDEGQADLLSRVACIPAAAFRACADRLPGPAPDAAVGHRPHRPEGTTAAGEPVAEARAAPSPGERGTAASTVPPVSGPAAPHPAAERFLMQVMRDENAPLALRIEAAKALLPYAAGAGGLDAGAQVGDGDGPIDALAP